MVMNDEQHEVVYSDKPKILCLAGAGTGKTFSMISRITRLVSEGVDPDTILVLTFTNAAAFEMRERYKKLNNSVKCPTFRTFHSFCYYLLSTDSSIRGKLGYRSVPDIAQVEDTKRILKEAELQTGVHISEKSLGKAQFSTYKEKFQYDILMKAYKRIMIQDNIITFDRLCYDVCELFERDDNTTRPYKDKYKYIFVDEFQDTDSKQYKFICSFKHSNLFVVGDALQAIYAFRGADSSIIKNIAEDTLWSTYKLTKNYRSVSRICNFANSITCHVKDTYRIKINSDVPGGSVILVESSGFNRRGEIHNDKVLCDICNFSSSVGTTAILCRTNAEVKFLKQYLKTKGISINQDEDKSETINILKAILDDDFCMKWLATLLNSADYAEFIRQSIEDSYDLTQFIESFGKISEIERLLTIILNIRSRGLDFENLTNDDLIFILTTLNVKDIDIDGVVSLNMLQDRIENHLNSDVTNDVYVGTIHSSKGLEYDNVAVIGVDGSSFPLTNEENNNIYYVAVTRAKKNLLVFLNSQEVYYERDTEYNYETSNCNIG